MDDLETKLLRLPLKSPSDALDARIFRAAGHETVKSPMVRPRYGLAAWFTRFARLSKTAAAVLIAATLIGVGWAGEKVYEKLTRYTVVLEEGKTEDWTLPNGVLPGGDGQKLYCSECTVTHIDGNDPAAVAKAKSRHEEMKRLIAEKKYEFVKTFDSYGEKQYVYRFTFADGSHEKQNFPMPLDKVASWDDYQQKYKELMRRQREQINKALAAGRFRLLDVEVICVHVCEDPATHEQLRVLRPARHQDRAMVTPIGGLQSNSVLPEMTWQEHLDAIKQGKRSLLKLETTPYYIYEVVLDDGSKAMFDYGGGEPLKKPGKAAANKKTPTGK